MTYCFTCRLEHLAIFIGEASRRWQVTQRSLTGQPAENETVECPKWDTHATPLPSRLRIFSERRGGVGVGKILRVRGSCWNQGNSVYQTQLGGCTYEGGDCDSMQKTGASSSQSKSQHGSGKVCMKPHPCLRRRVHFCIAVTTTHIPMSHSQDKVGERQKEEISREWEGMGETKEGSGRSWGRGVCV